MIVHVVMKDNGSYWPEDYCEEVEGVFSSRSKAISHIEGMGFVAKKGDGEKWALIREGDEVCAWLDCYELDECCLRGGREAEPSYLVDRDEENKAVIMSRSPIEKLRSYVNYLRESECLGDKCDELDELIYEVVAEHLGSKRKCERCRHKALELSCSVLHPICSKCCSSYEQGGPEWCVGVLKEVDG
ncbi:MAG: hypothetical protein RSG23_05055 [Gordonibacter sp.]|uniref:hypothetical protein n=1 Tax=Gordonibacter sp. TaxID=1968902 RepID=UPI002FCB7698